MEKSCEFCKLLRPVVYCKSDAAHLCLTCDAKVHSANALSYRHPRTLVCESCRHLPSLVRCFDHEMFMCQSCDAGHHASLEHRRKVVSCYLGCPSAKDLAELWGFDFKELENKCAEFEGRSSTRGTKLVNDENSHKSSYLILQQILELERLQLLEGGDSCLLHVKERTDGSQFRHDTMWREHKILDKQAEHLDDHLDFQQKGNALDDDKSEEPLTSPFPQLENPLNGDSFWQYKSPLRNNEFWLQNMQDLGVCDEVQCFDDVEIPDMDLTFRNFEEVFGTEQEQSRALQAEDTSMACSFTDKRGKLDAKLDKGCTSTIEVCNDVDKQGDTLEQVVLHHHPISPYSASSFSVSRITGESSGSEYKDDGVSPTHPELQLDSGSTKLNREENALTTYKEKKVLSQEKQGHYTSPRSKSGFKKRSKIQVSRAERIELDSPNATRSF